MTLIEHYRQLIAYDAWTNREALHSLRAAGRSAPERALAIMSHIAAAERVWLERLNHRKSKPPVWPELSLEQVEQELETVLRDWKAILAQGEAELARSVDYHNSKGERWVNSVRDVLEHVMMHGVYHRGQIATLLRQNGAAPASTDYIEAVRRGFV